MAPEASPDHGCLQPSVAQGEGGGNNGGDRHGEVAALHRLRHQVSLIDCELGQNASLRRTRQRHQQDHRGGAAQRCSPSPRWRLWWRPHCRGIARPSWCSASPPASPMLHHPLYCVLGILQWRPAGESSISGGS